MEKQKVTKVLVHSTNPCRSIASSIQLVSGKGKSKESSTDNQPSKKNNY